MSAGVQGALGERFVSQVAWSTDVFDVDGRVVLLEFACTTGFRSSGLDGDSRTARVEPGDRPQWRFAEAAVPVAAGLGAAVGSRTPRRLCRAEHPGDSDE